MVFPSLLSILAAVSVALLSTSIVLYKRRVEVPFFASKNQDEKVFFALTPAQRNELLRGQGWKDASLENKIRNAFQSQGYVIVRGLLNNTMLDRLDAAGNVFMQQESQVAPQTFSALRFGPVYLSAPNSSNTNETDTTLSSFRHVSMESAIPSFIAQVLLELQPASDTLRVLKDVFLAKGNESDYCGWHVDDQTFWPIQYLPTIKQGVNAWIAMDVIPAKYGGGLAVSPQSHVADWRHQAYETIGSTPTYPPEGYNSVASMFENYKTTTCNLAKAEPELAAKIDETMHVFDFERGDVLIHTRWLFHRSVPLTNEGRQRYGKEAPAIRRYSIRYETGSAQLLKGFSLEPSVVLRPDLSGKTLDAAMSESGIPWYPQCWPSVNADEMEHLHEVTETHLPAYEPLKKDLFDQIMPYFRKG